MAVSRPPSSRRLETRVRRSRGHGCAGVSFPHDPAQPVGVLSSHSMDAATLKSLARDFFEHEFESYGDVVPQVGQKKSELARSLQRIQLLDPARVLDLSTGTGFVVRQLLTLFPGCWIVGLDFSEKILRAASRKFPSVSFQIADAERLPFGEEVFSLAVCRYSFHHFPHVADHLREVRRILRPGGTYLILDPVPFEGTFEKEIHRVFSASESDISGHVRYYTEGQYRHFLAEAGFTLVSTNRYPVRIRWSRTIHRPLIAPLLTMSEPVRARCDLSWDGESLSLTLPAMALEARRID